MSIPEPVIVTDVRCELAENPLWDAHRECVYWTDIPKGKIFRMHWPSKKAEVVYDEGIPVGGFTFQESGELLLFRVDDIALLQLDGKVRSIKSFKDHGMARFNDVIADPEGRVFAGTIGTDKQSGGLYRVDADKNVTKLHAGTGCANGMGFSPDLKSFYWTCSTTRRIYRFAYDRSSGDLRKRELFYETQPEEGVPDGLAVDSDGCVWSARWAGAAIKKHAPDGKVLATIRFPAANVTSLCFCGHGLNELFVTTAKNPEETSDLGGTLFKLSAFISGRQEFRSKLRT